MNQQVSSGGAEGDRTLDLRIANAKGSTWNNDLGAFGGLKRPGTGLGGTQMLHAGATAALEARGAAIAGGVQ